MPEQFGVPVAPPGVLRGALSSAVLLLTLLAAGAPAQVVINEVLYLPDPASSDAIRTHQWVELFNKGADAADLSNYVVSGRDGNAGASARNLPGVFLPPGGYLVVHFAGGANRLDFADGSGDYYTGDDPGTPVWNWAMDEAALYSPDGIVDFISWFNFVTPYAGGQAHDDAVAAGIWTQGRALNTHYIATQISELGRYIVPGVSIGRDDLATDTDSIFDFDAHGGQYALDITPGRANADVVPFTEVPAATPARAAGVAKKWTVLLYFAGDNSLSGNIAAHIATISAAGGSDDNVNFVVMADLKATRIDTKTGQPLPNQKPLSQTVRGLILKPNSASGNVKFTNGALFGAGVGTQAFTDANGLAQVTFTATAGGTAQFAAYTGSSIKTLSIPITGAPPAPDSLQVGALPLGITPGDSTAISVTLKAGSQQRPARR